MAGLCNLGHFVIIVCCVTSLADELFSDDTLLLETRCDTEAIVGHCFQIGCFWDHGPARCSGTQCLCKAGYCSYDGWHCVAVPPTPAPASPTRSPSRPTLAPASKPVGIVNKSHHGVTNSSSQHNATSSQHAPRKDAFWLPLLMTVLLVAFVVCIVLCLVSFIWQRLSVAISLHWPRRGMPNSVKEPLLSEQIEGNERCVAEEVIASEKTAQFNPPYCVFDFTTESQRQVRCIRIEAPGRRVDEDTRSVTGELEIGSLTDSGGTFVKVSLVKRPEIESTVKPVMLPDEFRANAQKSVDEAGLNVGGSWTKTFEFTDGVWDLLEPPPSDAKDRDAKDNGGSNHSFDVHGVWHIKLTKWTREPSRTYSVGSASACDQYHIGSTCADSVVADEEDIEIVDHHDLAASSSFHP